MHRESTSHKGQNGTVAIVGGSHLFHGAPIFAALAAEASGVDLIYPYVHACHGIVTRMASLNFIVHTFAGNSLTEADMKGVLALLREVHAAVLGSGMAETKENEVALHFIVSNAPCALVLDARALRRSIIRNLKSTHPVILTPHLGELEHLTGRTLTGIRKNDLRALVQLLAEESGATILLKGPEDFIVNPQGKKIIIRGGNAGLTKGGTGDALAGLIAGLIAQNVEPFDACVQGATILKKAGKSLFQEKGYAYSAEDTIHRIPPLLTSQWS